MSFGAPKLTNADGRIVHDTHDPEIQATRNTSYLTASKSLNGRKIARMAPILTIFGPNRSQRRNLFFEKFSNERRRHRGIARRIARRIASTCA